MKTGRDWVRQRVLSTAGQLEEGTGLGMGEENKEMVVLSETKQVRGSRNMSEHRSW